MDPAGGLFSVTDVMECMMLDKLLIRLVVKTIPRYRESRLNTRETRRANVLAVWSICYMVNRQATVKPASREHQD